MLMIAFPKTKTLIQIVYELSKVESHHDDDLKNKVSTSNKTAQRSGENVRTYRLAKQDHQFTDGLIKQRRKY